MAAIAVGEGQVGPGPGSLQVKLQLASGHGTLLEGGTMRATLLGLAVLALGCQNETGLTQSQVPAVDGIPGELETPFRVDRITQVTIPKTDVLFVVDNCCSMEEEQNALHSVAQALQLHW